MQPDIPTPSIARMALKAARRFKWLMRVSHGCGDGSDEQGACRYQRPFSGHSASAVLAARRSALHVLRKDISVVDAFQVALIAGILRFGVQSVGVTAACVVAVSPASGGGITAAVSHHDTHDTTLTFLAALADEFEHLLGEHRAVAI